MEHKKQFQKRHFSQQNNYNATKETIYNTTKVDMHQETKREDIKLDDGHLMTQCPCG